MRLDISLVLFIGLYVWTFRQSDASNVSNVSESVTNINKDVTKREANPKDTNESIKSRFFPDWVPFKKNIEELGELVPVKQKPKKRLALPLSYVLKTAAENDDVYDKDASVLNGEEDTEKKAWSDSNKEENEEIKDKSEEKINLSESREIISAEKTDTDKADLKVQNTAHEVDDSKEISQDSEEGGKKQKEVKSDEKEDEKEEEEEEDPVIKEARLKQEEEEKAKAKAQKEKVLKEVDQLKERHVKEQRLINEKNKDEFERDEFLSGKHINYNKYDKKVKKQKDYDDYQDITPEPYEKYPIHTSPRSRYRETTPEATTLKPTRRNARRINRKRKTKKATNYDEIKKTSYDIGNKNDNYGKETKEKFLESREIDATEPTAALSTFNDENIRISPSSEDQDATVVPKSTYAKKRRMNRRRKSRVRTTPAPDAYVAETIEEKASTAAVEDKPTALDILPSANEQVIKDAVAASSDHKKDDGIKNHEHKKGGGKEHHSEHHSEEEEHGKKAYEAHHEDTKTAKGHHDKEGHKGKYDDKGGHDKYHHKEGGHYGSHKHEEAGRKHAKYEESGKHSKGHSTKGSHNIHKKDEYEKKVEFFEEDGDSGEEEKHGGYKEEKEHGSGGKYKKGGLKANYDEHDHGKSGHFEKGGHVDVHKGHKSAGGHDSHGKHGHGHHHQGHKDSGKKWIYHHGHPAKTANLVVIDRRFDRFNHGPVMFYG